MTEEQRIAVSSYLTKPLVDWIDKEAERDRRPRTKQIEYFLEEMQRVREHNKTIRQDKAKQGK
jgi:hypothetical protein